jgi:hypothetical protein
MNIVLYSDKNYEYQVINLIHSLRYGKIYDYKILYYTIDFDSIIKDPNVTCIKWDRRKDSSRFEFYKPTICIDALGRLGGNFYFLDTDIIISKRFLDLIPAENIESPGFCVGPIDYPHTYWEDHTGRTIFDEVKLMKYLGVTKRTNSYIMSCFFTFNSLCLDFLEEWESFCTNKFLMKDQRSIFPFTDESIANVLLWRRNLSFNYGRRFINTHKFSTFRICEENDNIINTNIDNNIYERCDNSSLICFYHGTKSQDENQKILNYINENS